MTVVIDGTTGIDTVQDGTVAPADLTTGAPSWNSAGNLSFNSGYGSVATAYGCRAWVNFNGTGTVAIRASGNVSSITDNSTGNFTVNFSTALPDANYSAVLTLGETTGDGKIGIGYTSAPTSSAWRLLTFNYGNAAAADPLYANVAIFR